MNIQNYIKNVQDNYSSLYKGTLYTHYPMAIHSLDELGATKKQIEDFSNSYIKRHEKIKEDFSSEIICENWKNYLGQDNAQYAYHRFFVNELNSGLVETLEKYLPELIKGVSAYAFHPLIRLGHALKRNDLTEIAYSLATWAAGHISLGDLKFHGTKDYIEVLEDLKIAFNEQNLNLGKGNIADRIKEGSKLEGFNNIVGSLRYDLLNLKSLSSLIVKLYAQTNNFTLLHALTSAQNLRIVGEYTDLKNLIPYYWQGIAGAYLSLSTPDLNHNFEVPEIQISWEEIISVAKNSADPHVIKLVYSAREEFKFYNKSIYKYAAALKAGLV